MGLAGVLRRWWWAVAAPVFAALALLSTFLSVYLIPDTHPLQREPTAADVRRLARAEGVPGTKADVQDVHRFTTAPNAESVGFGATRRVILWDTLLDGRFDRREVRVVIAHELGHLAHHHTLKRVGWLILFLIPAAGARRAVRRAAAADSPGPRPCPSRCSCSSPCSCSRAPLMNIVSRRDEAEADWSALRATHDPAAPRARCSSSSPKPSLADPDPPTWSYVLYDDHPTIVQRIAMVDAWQARRPR